MIYELVGLPGSGKSHLFKYFSEKSDIKKITVNYSNKVLITILGTIGALMYFKQTYLFIKNAVNLKKVDMTLIYNLLLCRSAKLLKANFVKNALIDEGLWQNCLSVKYKEADMEKLSKIYSNIKIIFIDINEDVRQVRLKKRPIVNQNHFLKDEEVVNWFKKNSFMIVSGETNNDLNKIINTYD